MNRTKGTRGPSRRGDARVLSRGTNASKALRLAIVLALAWPQAGAGQEAQQTQTPPVFPSGVATVRVDVVVTDAKGRPVAGLSREDFAVREDGVPQAIVDFEAVGDGRSEVEDSTALEPAPDSASRPAAAVALPASFLIVVDEPHLTPEQARNARAFVAELLKTLRAGDRVTLVAGHDGRWWSGVGPKGAEEVAAQLEGVNGRLPRSEREELMTPYEAMRIVEGDRQVEQVVRARAQAEVGLPPVPGASAVDATSAQVSMRARVLYDETMLHSRRLLDLVSRTLELVPRQRGRTTLLIASGGFLVDPLLGEYRELVRRFVRSGVTAYFYDARDLSIGRGLGADAAGRMGGTAGRLDQGYERRRDEDLRLRTEAVDGDASGAMRLADETGGFTIRVSDTSGLDRLASDARQYYLLGYVPTNTKRDGQLRRISVEVRARGASVRARKAYYAPTDKDERSAARPAAVPAAPLPASSRDAAASRYVALVESHRTAPGAETLDALSKWSARDLRRAAMAVAADSQGPPERRWGAVLLHTDGALRHEAAGERDAAEEQRAIARELLGRVRGTRDDADFERLWFHAMGDHSLELARIADALELFDALVERYPADAEAQLARGRVHEAALFILSWAVRPSRAEQPDLTSDVFAYNRYRRPHAGAPVLASQEAHRGSAILSFRAALRLSPTLVEARLRLGRVLWLDGKVDEAERELRAVVAGPSPDGRHLAHLFLSRIEDERGRLSEALAHAEAAVALHPQWQSSRLELADLLRRAGRGGEASLAVLAALAPDPAASQDGWLRYNLGAHDRAALVLEAMRAMVRP